MEHILLMGSENKQINKQKKSTTTKKKSLGPVQKEIIQRLGRRIQFDSISMLSAYYGSDTVPGRGVQRQTKRVCSHGACVLSGSDGSHTHTHTQTNTY